MTCNGKPSPASKPHYPQKLRISAVFHCKVCGLTLENRDQNYRHICPRRPTEPHNLVYQEERLKTCEECEHKDGDTCRWLKKKYPNRKAAISVGVKLPFAKCPNWGPQQIQCPDCQSVLFNPHKTPDHCKRCGWADIKFPFAIQEQTDLTLISGCDEGFIRGAYLMFWSALRTNTFIKCILYYDGQSNHHLEQLKSWGVEIRPMPLDVPKTVFGWQTFNKPSMILDALKTEQKVLWLDSDIGVGKPLHHISYVMDKHPFVPDHGMPATPNTNAPEVDAVIGPPQRQWTTRTQPCAGVFGVHQKDRDFVQEWKDGILKLMEYPKLISNQLNHGHQAPLMFQDQGVLYNLFRWPTDKGQYFNNFGVSRTGSIEKILAEVFNGYHAICHFGGATKPWNKWSETLYWPDPRNAEPEIEITGSTENRNGI